MRRRRNSDTRRRARIRSHLREERLAQTRERDVARYLSQIKPTI